ncbi:thioredoxin family protein [Micromonospora sp. NPDC047730]|uniref:thioredoxin family protein n=1 Tax=Micromonospora sp. NPDC047730 TaxID=3364253 RepID=UPI00371262C7
MKTRFFYFSAEWCQPCKRFGPLLTTELADRGLELVKCDIDTDGGAVAARTFGVMSVPKVLAVRAGQVVDDFGYMPATALRERLDALTA